MPEYDIKTRTYKYSLAIIEFVKTLDYSQANKVIANQLLRCGTSIGANVFEGYAGSSKKDFINYYNIALKSSNETVYWLNLVKDSVPNTGARVSPLIKEAEELSKILAKIIINSRR